MTTAISENFRQNCPYDCQFTGNPQISEGDICKLLRIMVRPGRFELPTSCFGVHLSTTGARRISTLDVRLSATVGFIGQVRLVFVQQPVQRRDGLRGNEGAVSGTHRGTSYRRAPNSQTGGDRYASSPIELSFTCFRAVTAFLESVENKLQPDEKMATSSGVDKAPRHTSSSESRVSLRTISPFLFFVQHVRSQHLCPHFRVATSPFSQRQRAAALAKTFGLALMRVSERERQGRNPR